MPRDVEAGPGPASRRPSGRRRLQGQVSLVLASACVFSVAVIGRTHPPFPAPKVRRRDEAGGLGAPTLTPSPQDPFSVYWAEMLQELNDDAWWRFICRLVVRNGTRTSLYVERHATRNYAHALYNTVLYNRMCLERGGIAAEEASLTLPASLANQRGAIERELGNISLTFSRAAKHPHACMRSGTGFRSTSCRRADEHLEACLISHFCTLTLACMPAVRVDLFSMPVCRRAACRACAPIIGAPVRF